MLALPNDKERKFRFESKAILMAFSIAIVAILMKGYAKNDMLAKLDIDSDPSAKRALQQMNLQYVQKESLMERARAEKNKNVERSIASVFSQNQKTTQQE